MAMRMSEREYEDFLAAKKQEEEFRQQNNPVKEQPQPRPEKENEQEERGTVRRFVDEVKEGAASARMLARPGETSKRMPAIKKDLGEKVQRISGAISDRARERVKESGGVRGIAKATADEIADRVEGGSNRMIQADRANYYNRAGSSRPSDPHVRIATQQRRNVSMTTNLGHIGSGPSARYNEGKISFNTMPGWGMAAPKKAAPKKASPKKASPKKASTPIGGGFFNTGGSFFNTGGSFFNLPSTTSKKKSPSKKTGTSKSTSTGFFNVWGSLPTIGLAPAARKKAPARKTKKGGKKNGKKR